MIASIVKLFKVLVWGLAESVALEPLGPEESSIIVALKAHHPMRKDVCSDFDGE
jgi:hypothetical protein